MGFHRWLVSPRYLLFVKQELIVDNIHRIHPFDLTRSVNVWKQPKLEAMLSMPTVVNTIVIDCCVPY